MNSKNGIPLRAQPRCLWRFSGDGAQCTLDEGHRGRHAAGLPLSWRLRNYEGEYHYPSGLMAEAATEIDRLNAHILQQSQQLEKVLENCNRLNDEKNKAVAALPSSHEEKPDELGWVIEKRVNGELHYWTGHDSKPANAWSTKHQDALRFAREIDGTILLAWILDGNGRVVQHLWNALPSPPQEPT